MSEPANFTSLPLTSAHPIVISLFGPFQVHIKGKPITHFRLNKTRALLAYLLVERPQPLLRATLAELLWPGYTTPAARTSLRQALDDLRNVLAPFPLLYASRDHIELQADPAVLWCDVSVFHTLLASWQRHEHLSLADCQICRDRLQQATALASEKFLDNLPDVASPAFEAWVQTQRARLAEQLALTQAALAPAKPLSNFNPTFTSLIGRTVELDELTTKLQDPVYRCVSIVGPGGIGKTRLALALGAQQKANFPDGVWLVSLTPSTPPTNPPANATPAAPSPWVEEHAEQCQDHIATAIGAALGITFQGAQRPSAQMVAYLRDKAALLLLDNFEMVIAGAELLLQFMTAASRLRLVVISRQRLPLQAQLVYLVKGLPTPPATAEPVADTSTAYASVQLFLERAQSAGFTVTRDAATLATIGELCRWVDGSPWAIELAVGLLDDYAPAALLQAIQADYRALTGAWLDLPFRLRSAEAVLHTMWGLLTPHEAQQLTRCAVFRGDFTRTAVQAIAEATDTDLETLVHKSLLHPSDEDRFTLHELVRQFAAEQLAQNGADQQTVATRHAAYYIALLQAQETALLNHSDAQTVIQAEFDNCRAAWQWSVAQADLALLAQAANGLFTFYGLAGLYHEAIQQLAGAFVTLRQLQAAIPTDATVLQLLALLLTYAADFYQRTGALATSAQLGAEALALGQELADPAVQAFAYNMLMRVAQARSNLPAMQTLATAGCTQARLAQRFDLLSKCLSDLGICFLIQQQMAAATAAFEEGLQALEGAPNRYLEAQLLANLGQVRFFTKEYELARHYLQKSHDLHQTLRDQEARVSTQLMLGDLWRAIGAYPAAQQEYEQAQTRLQRTANPYSVGWLQISYGYWRHLCGDPATAVISLTLGRQTAQQSGNRLFEAVALFYLGYVLIAEAAWERAQACFAQSLALQTEAPWLLGAADVHAGLAICLHAQGETEAAVAQVDTVLDLLAQHGVTVASELFLVYWLCFQVLQTVDEARAVDVLRTVDQRLHACAAEFEESALRRAFLNEVAVNRRLVAAAQAVGLH